MFNTHILNIINNNSFRVGFWHTFEAKSCYFCCYENLYINSTLANTFNWPTSTFWNIYVMMKNFLTLHLCLQLFKRKFSKQVRCVFITHMIDYILSFCNVTVIINWLCWRDVSLSINISFIWLLTAITCCSFYDEWAIVKLVIYIIFDNFFHC